jgi:butyrate kinase
VLDAMIYNVAKAIGAAATVLCGKVDAILLTGGIAHSHYIISHLKERIAFLAPVHVYPGEDEMLALAQNAIAALRGTRPIQVYS